MKQIFLGILFFLLFDGTSYAQSDDATSKWLIRARGVWVSPSESDNLDGAKVNVSDTFIPELDFTYFFNKNMALELILGTSKHEVDVDGALDLGHVWLLPPTLTFQYHFPMGNFKPYIGAGLNYTFFYGEDPGDAVDMSYDSSIGYAFQLGADYFLNDSWFINVDVKKILLSTDVDVTLPHADAAKSYTPTYDILPVKVDLDPLLLGVGVGYRIPW